MDNIIKSVILLQTQEISEIETLLGKYPGYLRKLFKKNNLPSPSIFTNLKKLVILSEDDKTNIKILYENYFGKSKTVKQISKDLNIPDYIIKSFLKENNITHDSNILSYEEENLEKEIKKIVNFKLQKNLEDKKLSEIKTNSDKWLTWKDSFLEPFINFCKTHKHINIPIEESSKKSEYCIVLPVQDFHWGKVTNYNEINKTSQNSYEILESRLVHCTANLIGNAKNFGVAEEIYLTVGGDFFNMDTWTGTTTAGTAQDNENSIVNALLSGLMLKVAYINYLLDSGVTNKINLIVTPGNHDRLSSISLYTMISLFFMNNDRVCSKLKDELVGQNVGIDNYMSIANNLDVRTRQYVKYGNTLICFTHGDGMKAEDLPLTIAQEAREMWGQTENCVFFNGHFHHKIVKEFSGVIQFQVGSLSGADRWHQNKGYVTSNKTLSFFLLNKDNGVFAELCEKVRF